VFSGDTRKALSNLKKHGVSFEEASTVFADPAALDWEILSTLPTKCGPKGWVSLLERILFVVYTVRRLKNGKEAIRIISARQATRKERKAYAG
jgi:uncharacterized protein